MPHDTCETIGRSLIQHGPASNRVYLMKLDSRDLPAIVGQLDSLVQREGYTKVFAKIPRGQVGEFVKQNYRQEAMIPGFYSGTEDALFLGKYFDSGRAVAHDPGALADVLALSKRKAASGDDVRPLPDGLKVVLLDEDHAVEMSRIYREVFPSYPFPIHDPAYLRETMESHVDYFGIVSDGRLVALSSAEMDVAGGNVEMTDFATLPSYRGQGLAWYLLRRMEIAMSDRGIQTAYTIARAVSPGMNITFARLGYHHCGVLINNTQISGSIESMNVWYKRLM